MKWNKGIVKLLWVFGILLVNCPSNAQFLKTSGTKITDHNGNEVILRGMGLGGWMLQEPYMMEMSGIASAQWQIKAKIQALIGAGNAMAFYDAWHASHCTEKDIDSLASWGFNFVRLPMHYNLFTLPIEEEPVPGNQTWLEKGFEMTDSLIAWCSARQIYVILDLHAAPGGQGRDYAICDGNPAHPSLWESDANKQKTIALWKKLAERYANEPWVGGYDLINEPNWNFVSGGNQNGCSETSNVPLRQLLINITSAIREVDTNHILIIEGNCWGNNYNGILPAWDNRMVVSFHKYWSYNDQNTIQSMLNIRSQYNIPLWLGESGENSNVWFTDAIRLVENNRIGWAWWPLKKINSVVNPLTINKTPEYQILLNYWTNGGTTPSVDFATNTLMQIAANAKIENCIYHKDVTDAMFRQVYDSTTRPFNSQSIPGIIHASDYDLGRNGQAYSDSDVATYQGSTGTYTAWNSGWSYRNDGVDIESNSDQDPASNGYDVGWTVENEWMLYTVEVDSSAAYHLQVRYAGPAGARIKFRVNDVDITSGIQVPSSGGYTTWNDVNIDDVVLYKGTQKVKLFFEKGGINLGFFGFSIQHQLTDIPLKPVSAETYKESEIIYLTFNKMVEDSTVSSDGFSAAINGIPVIISNLAMGHDNAFQFVLSLGQPVQSGDIIKLNYSGSQIRATDGTVLEHFSDLIVKNNLPVNFLIPGKIEAESFCFNQGFKVEATTDIGGGENVGFTDVGDYLDYRIKVLKSANYNFAVREACLNSDGIIQLQQLNTSGGIQNSATITLPVTGGWQTWQTVNGSISLTEGIGKLRVKVMKTEFNMNWYNITEKAQGITENQGHEMKIFPNPSRDHFTLEIPDMKGQKKFLVLRGLNGIVIKEMELPDNTESQNISVRDIPEGFYFLEVEVSGKILRTKLIIQ